MNVRIALSFLLGAAVLILCVIAWHYYRAYSALSNVEVSTQDTSANIFEVASSTGDPYLTVTADGRVGVGLAFPQATLDVRGMARIYTSSSTPCTQAIEGALAYDPLQKHFFGCNGTSWRKLDE